MRVNRDFEINGVKFHLNEGRKFVYQSKYEVVYYCENLDCWIEIGSANSKKEAIQVAKEFLKYHG